MTTDVGMVMVSMVVNGAMCLVRLVMRLWMLLSRFAFTNRFEKSEDR